MHTPMTRFQRAIIGLAVAALLGSAWMFRYSIVSGTRIPFVLDRWTGKVHVVQLTDE